ncbi:hypothetical protein CCF81_25200, partial [Salmonella enterica]|nr:hypothetical protein [Salmonella enterica]
YSSVSKGGNKFITARFLQQCRPCYIQAPSILALMAKVNKTPFSLLAEPAQKMHLAYRFVRLGFRPLITKLYLKEDRGAPYNSSYL